MDSCALVKLVRAEAESAALQAWLDGRPDEPVATSELAEAEVLRAVRRSNHTSRGVPGDAAQFARELAEAADVLARVGQVPLDRDLVRRAGAIEAPMLRTLDAIHLVSALDVLAGFAQRHFVTYDNRLAEAARAAGLNVVAPE